MLIPNPRETNKNFVKRCMSCEAIIEEHKNEKQRLAICCSKLKFRKKSKGKL